LTSDFRQFLEITSPLSILLRTASAGSPKGALRRCSVTCEQRSAPDTLIGTIIASWKQFTRFCWTVRQMRRACNTGEACLAGICRSRVYFRRSRPPYLPTGEIPRYAKGLRCAPRYYQQLTPAPHEYFHSKSPTDCLPCRASTSSSQFKNIPHGKRRCLSKVRVTSECSGPAGSAAGDCPRPGKT
jgi:hypothetical protein